MSPTDDDRRQADLDEQEHVNAEARSEAAQLWRAYLVCLERGHESDYGISYAVHGTPTKNHCKYCGTWFWAETIEHEEGAPEEPA